MLSERLRLESMLLPIDSAGQVTGSGSDLYGEVLAGRLVSRLVVSGGRVAMTNSPLADGSRSSDIKKTSRKIPVNPEKPRDRRRSYCYCCCCGRRMGPGPDCGRKHDNQRGGQ